MTGYHLKKRASVVVASAMMAAPATGWAYSESAAAAAAPDPAADWNHLWAHVLTDITVIGTVFAIAAVYMLIKFRATSPEAVGSLPKLTRAQMIAWALIPAAVFMADDFFLSAKGWVLWNTQRSVPAGALEIRLTGNQWYWEFDYGNGLVVDSRDEGELGKVLVPVGRPVVMRMTSVDVNHSFFVPAFRIKEDVLPGRKTYIWFVAKQAGDILATCTEFCGINHSQMPAHIKAVAPAEFDAWFKSKGKHASAAQPTIN
ncbi:MAG: hypothetical protein WCO00_15685 [Rhodospirillaceae bacterium]